MTSVFFARAPGDAPFQRPPRLAREVLRDLLVVRDAVEERLTEVIDTPLHPRSELPEQVRGRALFA